MRVGELHDQTPAFFQHFGSKVDEMAHRKRFHSQRTTAGNASCSILLPRFQARRAIRSHAQLPINSATGMRQPAIPVPNCSMTFS